MRSMTKGRELTLGEEQGGSGGGDSATVFNISGRDEKTSRAAPSIESETSGLRDEGLVRSEVAVPYSGVFRRRTFERGFEPGIVRRAKIGLFGFVCGRCGALPGCQAAKDLECWGLSSGKPIRQEGQNFMWAPGARQDGASQW